MGFFLLCVIQRHFSLRRYFSFQRDTATKETTSSSVFCSFFSRRGLHVFVVASYIPFRFLSKGQPKAGNVFFSNPKIKNNKHHGASSERKHDQPERPDRGIRGQGPHRGESRRTRCTVEERPVFVAV